jgi:hypothetical protein
VSTSGHPASRIIGDLNEHTTRSMIRNNSHFAHAAFVATFEPKDIGHALSDQNWVNSMHEELENFERNQVWELVDPPPGCKPIGTKWVWKNKEGEKGEVVINKSRLVLTDKRRIPLRSASVRTPHLIHHGIPKVLVNPRSKRITSVRSTFTL